MRLVQSILTLNDCYKTANKMIPKGIVVHSTGVNQTSIDSYLTSWNKSGVEKCVHAFIGYLPDGFFGTVQTLPFDFKCWGCGHGKKGSYNNSHIQFEICEDDLTDLKYFNRCYKEAVEFCADLCVIYNIETTNIVCHAESYRLGYGTNHADVEYWFLKFGKSMNDFRKDVRRIVMNKIKFNDISGNWAEKHIQKLADYGVVNG
ncbi:MAG: peptidoglycan recognition family protein, partial [Bacillota bacterium]|nr:peptidoglycan recognition family protein [Bacillota bacterium]